MFLENGSGNTIGGTAPGSGNVISGNQFGVEFEDETQDVVEGNFIGTDAAGDNALPNGGDGVDLSGGSENTIGGANAAEANIISGNQGYGLSISDESQDVLEGNFIGTDTEGNEALPNAMGGLSLFSGRGNTVGGSLAGSGNVVSGNQGDGIIATDEAQDLIEGNLIGTTSSGTEALPNTGDGLMLLNTTDDAGDASNTIGGSTAASRNVISGNANNGIYLLSTPGFSGGIEYYYSLTQDVLEGNFIGTNLSGDGALPNGGNGVDLSGGSEDTIGGTTAGAANIISGNQGDGIAIGDNQDVVEGNLIGTDSAGDEALPNGGDGIDLGGGSKNTIGGTTAAAANIISGNRGNGIEIGENQDVVEGNFIGTDSAGPAALPNASDGVDVSGGNDNTIGGTADGAGNTIANNLGSGVEVDDGQNGILGNAIYANTKGGIYLNYGNDEQASPLLTLLQTTDEGVTISGTLNTAPDETFRVEFFANPAGSDPVEGETYLGFLNVTTDDEGDASFTDTFSASQAGNDVISATATDPSTNTSEFSSTSSAAETTTVVTSSDNPSVFGQEVTFTAMVTVVAPNVGTPTGIVTFLDGASTLGTGALDDTGTASLSTSTLAVGSHPVTAVYGGDASDQASTSSAVSQIVNQASTTTNLEVSPTSTTSGQPVTLTATVAAVAPGAGTPTGLCSFSSARLLWAPPRSVATPRFSQPAHCPSGPTRSPPSTWATPTSRAADRTRSRSQSPPKASPRRPPRSPPRRILLSSANRSHSSPE